MSNHVTEWLNAYLDGELHGSRLEHVEGHLVSCQECLAELESLEELSRCLHEIPEPEFLPSERFAAQVSLRLPHTRATTYRRKALEIGWWMIPVGLIAAWFFINLSLLVNDMLSVANSFGLLTSISNRMMFDTPNATNWSTTLGQLGILRGNSLDLAASTEAFTRETLPQLILHILIALLYLSWFAIWWARRRHQENGQLLEG